VSYLLGTRGAGDKKSLSKPAVGKDAVPFGLKELSTSRRDRRGSRLIGILGSKRGH